jgi:hypothetical protein
LLAQLRSPPNCSKSPLQFGETSDRPSIPSISGSVALPPRTGLPRNGQHTRQRRKFLADPSNHAFHQLPFLVRISYLPVRGIPDYRAITLGISA